MPIFEYKIHLVSAPYILQNAKKTRANDAAADVLLQKHGLHNQKCSGGPVR